ncbi:hypothetical protein EB155_14330, partial [archaeon]|nr:hypothetical protein [archaeon]
MATRAAIIYIDDKGKMSATYNHYDGYPENLGKGLTNHYSDDFNAQKIASEGYISYMDPETGEIEQNNQSSPETYIIDDLDDAVGKINDVAQGMGADYVYIYVPYNNSWVNIKNQGRNTMINILNGLLPDILGISHMGSEDDVDMNESYEIKWQNFINENDDAKVRWEKIRDNAYRMLKQEDGRQVNDYVDSLVNQIKLNPS